MPKSKDEMDKQLNTLLTTVPVGVIEQTGLTKQLNPVYTLRRWKQPQTLVQGNYIDILTEAGRLWTNFQVRDVSRHKKYVYLEPTDTKTGSKQ